MLQSVERNIFVGKFNEVPYLCNLNALSERDVLNGRDVTLYPDADAITDWRTIARQRHWHDASLLVPDYAALLTAIAPTADIADYFTSQPASMPKP